MYTKDEMERFLAIRRDTSEESRARARAEALNGAEGGAVAMEFDFLERDDDRLGSLSREKLEAKCREELIENGVMWELMRDPKAGDPERLSRKQRTALGERLRRDFGYSLGEVLSLFGMWKSTYEYDARASERDAARRAEVDGHVLEAFRKGFGCFGYRRMKWQMEHGDGPLSRRTRTVARPTARRTGRGSARTTA